MNGVVSVVLLLGSNIEPRKKYLDSAIEILQEDIGAITLRSKIYESEPWGFEAKVRFLNIAIVINTDKSAKEVLKICLKTEQRLGRERKVEPGYSSRKVDVDVLYYGDEIVNLPELVIPHPRLHLRRFALIPLTDVVPDMVHPIFKKNQNELLEECQDKSGVKLFKA